jgi:hypothetical protein
MGRWIAARECGVYRHVTIVDASTWSRKLVEAGFASVEVQEYMPVPAARVMTRFSGATRVPILARMAGALSPQARALAGDQPRDRWVERCRRVLGPLVAPVAAGDDAGPGCGQLVLARKP